MALRRHQRRAEVVEVEQVGEEADQPEQGQLHEGAGDADHPRHRREDEDPRVGREVPEAVGGGHSSEKKKRAFVSSASITCTRRSTARRISRTSARVIAWSPCNRRPWAGSGAMADNASPRLLSSIRTKRPSPRERTRVTRPRFSRRSTRIERLL